MGFLRDGALEGEKTSSISETLGDDETRSRKKKGRNVLNILQHIERREILKNL